MRLYTIKLLLLTASFASFKLSAQRVSRDTSGTGSVDIVSSFKPILRDPVKIQFAAQPPGLDTNRGKLTYRIPSQELSITYQPGTLKPLAYQSDTNRGFAPIQFAKLGYGNLRNPYVTIAMQVGNKMPVNLLLDHRSAKGNMPFQNYSITSANIDWRLMDRGRGAWITNLRGERHAFNKYGFDQNRPIPVIDSIRQVFHQISWQLGYHRTEPTTSGFYVEPFLRLKMSGDRLSNRDLSVKLLLPIQYNFSDQLSIRLEGLVDWGRISLHQKSAIGQSVYSLSSSFRYQQKSWAAQVGIRPSWDVSGLRMYPDVLIQYNHANKPWSLFAKWSGELHRTSLQELFTVNPWLWMPVEWRNRGEVDRSIRWQYHRRANWTYQVQVGYATLRDPFLFINDTALTGDGKSFQVVYADRMQNIYAQAGLSFRKADQWLIRGEARWNNYHSIQGQAESWGLLPLEWKLNGFYNWSKRIRLQADVYSWFAPYYLERGGKTSRTEGAFDLNIGAEMTVTQSMRAWLQFNNLLNQPYQRWQHYPVYGFHFVGGVVFSLDKSIPR